VAEAARELSRVTEYDPQLQTMAGSLQELDSLLNDFNRELSSYVEELTFDEESFYETEKRLDLINGLKAKYGRTIEEILAYKEKQQKKLEELSRYEENLQKTKEELKKSEKELENASHVLSEIRQEYSKTLTEKITEGLRDLNFLDVQFHIAFQRKKDFTDNGFDDIQYEISTNPGEAVKPLGRIVSGGELSRIMLAIKTVLADSDDIPTLIFDEIDTGISGRTAQKVSEKLSYIAGSHQVICITHLPQIAAMADAHFEISKSASNGSTLTTIRILDRQASVEELARLLGGAEITDTVRKNAAEMKELADRTK